MSDSPKSDGPKALRLSSARSRAKAQAAALSEQQAAREQETALSEQQLGHEARRQRALVNGSDAEQDRLDDEDVTLNDLILASLKSGTPNARAFAISGMLGLEPGELHTGEHVRALYERLRKCPGYADRRKPKRGEVSVVGYLAALFGKSTKQIKRDLDASKRAATPAVEKHFKALMNARRRLLACEGLSPRTREILEDQLWVELANVFP